MSLFGRTHKWGSFIAKILQHPVKFNFGICQNFTRNRWQRIESKHEIDERVSCIMIISGLSVFRSLQFVY